MANMTKSGLGSLTEFTSLGDLAGMHYSLHLCHVKIPKHFSVNQSHVFQICCSQVPSKYHH